MINNSKVGTEKLDYHGDLIEAGKVKSAIDKVYPLSQIAKTHIHYEEGHTAGKIVISLEE